MVFPAAFVAGLQFPVLISLLGRGRQRVATHVGLAYAWNTAGAILGSLAGGFGLMPLLSATGTWIFVTCCWRRSPRLAAASRAAGSRALWIPLAGAAASVALVFTTGPTAAWRHSPIGAGRVNCRGLAQPHPGMCVTSAADLLAEGARRVERRDDGDERRLRVRPERKIGSNTRTDAPTQVMSGLIGAAVHRTRRARSSSGWAPAHRGLARHGASIERVDVVELRRSSSRGGEHAGQPRRPEEPEGPHDRDAREYR